jgi:YebC/PmpR family DNA-binding regulatory protein
VVADQAQEGCERQPARQDHQQAHPGHPERGARGWWRDPIVANLPLKNALAAAKSDNVPVDNIDRAIERAPGRRRGRAAFETVFYEGYGPGRRGRARRGLTDNRNRTVGEVRHVFTKRGGNLSGSVAWQFETKGMIVVERDDDAVAEAAIEAGADDIEVDEGATTVYTAPTALYDVVDALQRVGIEPQVSLLTKVPQTTTALAAAEAAKVVGSSRRSRISTTCRTCTAPPTCRRSPTRSPAEEGPMSFPTVAWDAVPRITGAQMQQLIMLATGKYGLDSRLLVEHTARNVVAPGRRARARGHGPGGGGSRQQRLGRPGRRPAPGGPRPAGVGRAHPRGGELLRARPRSSSSTCATTRPSRCGPACRR